ncbi:phosphoribosylformylglycinamidine synthase subunit PurL [Aquipuribacter hungaricus]|uniref:Phosphoribosylformylglycinamidine synthase subunit PurL n=1 Tax=Aquipuribacter hungaricus TaxID=545624 RepID=A0ABV7WIR6_9MICO
MSAQPQARVAVDSVPVAARTPDVEQPWAELGLRAEEYDRIRDILGRRPTAAELAMYSVMWSEHCSYKSSKVHLRRFGDATPAALAAGSTTMLAGIGENAGVVDIGDGWAVTFKAESHNHPSYVEPYQGAATGVGGIIRDIIAMGARPVAVMDSLRFGAVEHPDTARVVHGVVAGVGGYGNCIGLPNIGGEVYFDPSYQGNPLVNALCVGALRHEDLHLANATGEGNVIVLFGARTGGDGIGGVSVLASETFDVEADGSTGPSKRPAVQVGDPFREKLLIECCLELFHAGVVEGIQDLGGAGLSCATSELASAGDGGMRVALEKVPLRDPSLRPEEILMSESQERMMAVVRPERLEEFLAITDRWEVESAVLGEVTDTGRLEITWHGETVVDVPPRTVAHEGPVYERPYARPDWLDARQADRAEDLPRETEAGALRRQLLTLVASPTLCSRAWVTDQYDRYVLGNTRMATPDDAGVVRIDETTGRGIALALDGNGRFAALDPYAGAQLALSEAYRNVGVSGAVPIAVTDCLNSGSPEEPGAMWQFAEVVRGLADASVVLGTPVTGGNVSFYNSTGDTAIHPTPVVGVLGVLDDVDRRIGSGWAEPGLALYLLGTTREELSGSAWAGELHGHLGGLPPVVDLPAEQLLASVMLAASRDGLVDAAHDLSDGGLAQALVEGCLRHGTGARVWLDGVLERDGVDLTTALFSESAARAVVAVPRSEEIRFTDVATARGLPHVRIGVTDDAGSDGGEAVLEIGRVGTLGLAELRAAHEGTLPALFG